MFFRQVNEFFRNLRENAFLIGLLSLIWFTLRTGTKPSRAIYPCQRAAAANSYMWLTVYVVPFLSVVSKKVSTGLNKRTMTVALAITIVAASAAVLWGFSEMLMRGIKRVFDPNNIMNPGKIFDLD